MDFLCQLIDSLVYFNINSIIFVFLFFVYYFCLVVDDAGEVDTGSYGQSPVTYTRIFNLLSSGKSLNAVELAESAGLYRLATLLSQIGEDIEFVQLISYQLDLWADNGENENNTIPETLLDIYRLLGADPFPSDNWPKKSILKNIGWMRALSMIFWYCNVLTNPDGSVGNMTDSLLLFDDALKRDFVDQPTSHYISDKSKYGTYVQYPIVKHGLYNLLQVLFRDSSVDDMEMENKIINSLKSVGYTRDPLDNRAVYIILILLECMGLVSSSSTYACVIREQYISQLINEGLWIWAVFIAMQIPDDSQRSFIVKEMIMRYAVTDGEVPLSERTDVRTKKHDPLLFKNMQTLKNINSAEEVYFLVDILHVPIVWIHTAAANRHGYSHNYFKQVQHLNFAQLWPSAREIVCVKLAPMILLQSNSATENLLNLLESMEIENGSGVEDIWSSRGNVLLTFLRLKSSVDDIVKAKKSINYGVNNYDNVQMSTFENDLQDIIHEAKSLLERVHMLNTTDSTLFSYNESKSKKPTIQHATLLNIGTYLFDLIDRLTLHNDNDDGNNNTNIYENENENDNKYDNIESDLYESVCLFQNSITANYPVQGNHILRSLEHHSSIMLKESANRLSQSYRMSHSSALMNVE